MTEHIDASWLFEPILHRDSTYQELSRECILRKLQPVPKWAVGRLIELQYGWRVYCKSKVWQVRWTHRQSALDLITLNSGFAAAAINCDPRNLVPTASHIIIRSKTLFHRRLLRLSPKRQFASKRLFEVIPAVWLTSTLTLLDIARQSHRKLLLILRWRSYFGWMTELSSV